MTANQKLLAVMLVLDDPVPVEQLPTQLSLLSSAIAAVVTAWQNIANRDTLIHAARIASVSELQHAQDATIPVLTWAQALSQAGGA